MNPKTPHAKKYTAAVELLAEQGYTWFPGAGKWERYPGLTLAELGNVSGWFRCGQVKPVAKTLTSWDGYTFVNKEGEVTHFDLWMKQRKWSPSIGYEHTMCFVPIDIIEELQSKLTPG